MKIKFLFVFISLLLILSCNKNDYFLDTGVHDLQYNENILEYLEKHPNHFNKLVEIIDYTNSSQLFRDSNITFFAPQNLSINKLISQVNKDLLLRGRDTVQEITDIKPEVWKHFLFLYVINDNFKLKDISQIDTVTFAFEGQSLVSLNGRIMKAGVIHNNANGVQYAGYRMVLYSYINDFSDIRRSLINVPVSSSNIILKNGVVHVLRARDHFFGFRSQLFLDAIINGGMVDKN